MSVVTEAELRRRKDSLVAYLRMKLDAGDWHAVQDAASDIRELDAQIEFLRQLEREAPDEDERLRSAAPDLLQACKMALNDRLFNEWPGIATELMAAIKKAGSEPSWPDSRD